MNAYRLYEVGKYIGGSGVAYHILKTGSLPCVKSITDYDLKAWEWFYAYCRSTYEWDEQDQLKKETVTSDGDRQSSFMLHLKAGITICNMDSRDAKLLDDASSDQAVLEDLAERFRQIAPAKSESSIG